MLELFFPKNKPYNCLSLICVLCSTKKGGMGLIFLILRTILHLKNNYSEPVAHWHSVCLLTPKHSLNMLLLVSGDGWGVWRQRNRLKSNNYLLSASSRLLWGVRDQIAAESTTCLSKRAENLVHFYTQWTGSYRFLGWIITSSTESVLIQKLRESLPEVKSVEFSSLA